MHQLFHIYIGTNYQGPARGKNAGHAIMVYAQKNHANPKILHAKPAIAVQDLKAPKSKKA